MDHTYSIIPAEEVYVQQDAKNFPTTIHEIPSNFPLQEYKWNDNNSKILIDLYEKFRPKIGILEMKNLKNLWTRIAEEFKKMGIPVSPNHCSNRWKVLERNYKKFVDNKNKTGAGRKYFPYEEEMDRVLGKKRNICPEILLSSSSLISIKENVDISENIPQENIDCQQPEAEKENSFTPTNKGNASFKSRQIRKRTSAVEKLRADRKAFYEERLLIEKEKILQMKRRNDLIEKRNSILINKCCNCSNPS